MIYDVIQADIKQAMLSKNNIKRDCLRSVVSEIKNQTVNAGKSLTEDICVKVLNKAVKQHNDSIEQFKSAGRNDLVEKETTELGYLTAYLPKTMSETETEILISDILNNEALAAEKKNMGRIMKMLPATVDKKIAVQILNRILK